jgi:RNA polymerase sigma-70 factor, ECF subfamily
MLAIHHFSKSNGSKGLTYQLTGVLPDCAFRIESPWWMSCENHSDETERKQLVRGIHMLTPTLQYTTGSTLSDEALMEAITAQRPEALTEFYSRHGGRLKSVIGNVVHEEGDADDVLQDILLQIWHEADHYSPKEGKLLGWVVTLARRRAIDRLRRKQAYCRAKDRYQAQLNEQPLSTENHSSEDQIARSDLRSFLHRRLNLLPKQQREALELAFFAGMSHREIAAVTRAPLGTVKTRLELGLQKLTQSLKPLRHKI